MVLKEVQSGWDRGMGDDGVRQGPCRPYLRPVKEFDL